MERVDVGGLDIAFEQAGAGPPVVLLHGYVGDGRSLWHRQLETLSTDYTVVAWDAPGSGGSSDPPEEFGITGYAECLASFIDALGLRRPHIVGLSFGGALALELYRRHPELATTLVLVSAYAGWFGSLPAEVAHGRLEQAGRLSRLSGDEFVEALLPTMFAAPVAPADLAAFRAAMETFHPAGFRAMARASAEDLSSVPPTVDLPTLLVYGARDVRAPLSVAHDLHGAIALSQLVILDGVGHICNLEAPEEFDRVLLGFLAEQHGG